MGSIIPKNILIVRTDRIGDVVLTLPMAALIKRHYPNCRITFLLREYTKPLAVNNPFVDEVIVLKEENGKVRLMDMVRQLRKHSFDSAVVVYPSWPITLMTFLSGIKHRIGTGYRWYSFLFSHRHFEHRKYAERHEAEYNVNLLRFFSINESIDVKTAEFGIGPVKESEEKIVHLLNEKLYDFSRPMAVFHPGSGGSARDWPKNRMKELIGTVARELPVNVVLTGSAAEKQLCEELSEGLRAYNFAGELDLYGLIALLNRADVMVANSTGPIHIAAALGRPVVGFYPNITACSPRRWGPYTPKSSVFTPKAERGDVQSDELGGMDTIETKEVFESIKVILKARC